MDGIPGFGINETIKRSKLGKSKYPVVAFLQHFFHEPPTCIFGNTGTALMISRSTKFTSSTFHFFSLKHRESQSFI